MSTTIVSQDAREINSLLLIAANAVIGHGNIYTVTSQSKPEITYAVNLSRTPPTCTCPDSTYRHNQCKHIRAAQLTAELRAEIQEFLDRRPDVTLADIEARARQEVAFWEKALPLASSEELKQAKAGAFAVVAAEMLQPPKPTAMRQAIAFSLRFWWPGVQPERAIDPLSSDLDKVKDPEVRGPQDAGFRKPGMNWSQILAYAEEKSLRIAQPQPAHQKRGSNTAREWLFQADVVREVK